MTKLWHFAIAFCLMACEPSELRPVPVPLGGSGSNSAPSRSAPAPQSTPLAPPANPMIQDPEGNLEDVAIEIKADSETQAQSKCEDQARMRSDAQTIATCLGCKKRTKTTGKYMCTIRIETTR